MTSHSNTNCLGFKTVSDSMRKQLFPTLPKPQLSGDAAQRVADHYRQFGVDLPVSMPQVCEYDFQLPKLQGNTLAEHFSEIGREFAEPYDIRVRKLLKAGLPPIPKATDVVMRPGWYRYAVGEKPVQVDNPLEDVFVLDCETYVLAGALPIIATCASEKAWYVWLDPALCDLSVTYQPNLYSIGDGKLLLGHNATYDFQRSIESHWLDLPAGKKRNYFLCSMSMNIVCNGFSGQQRWVTNAKEVPGYAQKWADVGCANSLVAAYNFHTWPEVPLGPSDKQLRNMFVTCHLPELHANFTELIEYALLDVQYTFDLFKALYPVYRQKRPSWVSLAGAIQQSAHNLPVVDNWHEWVQGCETKLVEYEALIDTAGRDIADGVYKRFADVLAQWSLASGLTGKDLWQAHNNLLAMLPLSQPELELVVPDWLSSATLAAWYELMTCPWLGHQQLNWAIRPRVKSNKGWPEWRRTFTEYTKSSRQLHMFMKIQTEDGHPVYWGGRASKWVYKDSNGVVHTIPKPGTEELGISLLDRVHSQLFEEGKLKVTAEGGENVLKLAMAMTYWVSCRGRVMSEIVSPQVYKSKDGSTGTVNVICPTLVPNGTISGRGVAPLWLTVTDCKDYNNFKLGVELKSRVQSPPGKVLMSADMSAQELRIGAIYADSIAAKSHYADTAQLGYLGSSLMSHGVYAGNKELGTDAHSMLAKSVGVSRNGAKTAGYALLYGAGVKTIAVGLIWDYVKLNLPKPAMMTMAEDAAKRIIAHKRGKTVRGTGVFSGGCDSAAYTVLGQLASKPYPKTPLLGNMLTAPMCPANCGNDFVTGRSNFMIQATARDSGDCLMVAYEWLCRKHRIDSRVLFCLHDEYVTITDKADTKVAAWLFSVAHAWTWAYLNEAMGIYDMCSIGVFFDDVLLNNCLRKNHNWKTNTPTNLVEVEDMPDGEVVLEWDLPTRNLATLKLARQVCPEIYTGGQLADLDSQPAYVH